MTFCEFFAAWNAIKIQRRGWAELLQAYRNLAEHPSGNAVSRLDQVIPFAAGLAPSSYAREDAIADVQKLDNPRLLALSFLETNHYNSSAWFAFCRERFVYFLDVLTNRPSEMWLNDLHLFAVVIKDFSNAASADCGDLARMHEQIDLDNFFAHFANAEDTALRRVLQAYASRDPAAVFRIATLCQFDILSEMPGPIADNCDDPAMFALAVKAARTDKDRASAWAEVLAAAALRSGMRQKRWPKFPA